MTRKTYLLVLSFVLGILVTLGAEKVYQIWNDSQGIDSNLLNNNEEACIDPFQKNEYQISRDLDHLFQTHYAQSKKVQIENLNHIRNSIEKWTHNRFGYLSEPSSDIKVEENKNEIMYQIEIPKYSNKDVQVKFDRGLVLVRGTTHQFVNHASDGAVLESRFVGQFQRNFFVNVPVEPHSLHFAIEGEKLNLSFKKTQ